MVVTVPLCLLLAKLMFFNTLGWMASLSLQYLSLSLQVWHNGNISIQVSIANGIILGMV